MPVEVSKNSKLGDLSDGNAQAHLLIKEINNDLTQRQNHRS